MAALPAPTLDDRDAHAHTRWVDAGLAELTGPADGPGLGPPIGLVDRLDAVTERIRTASAALGHEVRVDGLGELAARAEPLGLRRRGRVSCGGACQLVRAVDGWFAVSLCRPDDWELLPAWIGSSGDAPDRWDEVHTRCRALRRDDVVARGALLGLPIGALPDLGRDETTRTRTHESAVTASAPDRAGSDGAVPSARTGRLRGGGPLRVADLSSMWAGPLCGAVLAAAGAQVLKVESTARPDGMRHGPIAMFDRLNDGKEQVVVDLACADGVHQLRSLLRSVDVVIESSRPRALQQLGIDAAELLADAEGPDVWVSITGHGRDGEAAQRVAFGDDAAVAGGLVSWFEDEPVFCSDAIADPLTGLTAAASALEALDGRDASVPGTRPILLDVAMSRVAAHFAGATGETGVRCG